MLSNLQLAQIIIKTTMYQRLKTLTPLFLLAHNTRYHMCDKFEPRKKYYSNPNIPKYNPDRSTNTKVQITSNIKQIFSKAKDRIDAQSMDIISELIFKDSHERNTKSLTDKLDAYLNIHRNLGLQSVDGLVYLLTAISFSKDQNYSKYRKLIIEILSRKLQIETLTLHSECIGFFLQAVEEARSSSLQKARSISMLYFLINTLNNSFDNIHIKFYVRIMEIIFRQNQQSRILNVFRTFIQKVQLKMHHIFLDLLSKDPSQSSKTVQFINEVFFLRLLKLYSITGSPSTQCVQSLLNVLTVKFLPEWYRFQKNKQTFLYMLNQIYRMFPSGYHDNEGKEYKDLLVNKIYERYYKDNLDLLTFSAIGHHFLSSVIYQYFNWYGKTRNHCHEGHFNYLLPSEIQQPPELPQFFWTIYDKNPANCNHTPFIRHTVKDCYPKRYKQTQFGHMRLTQVPFLDTEMAMRAAIALQQLGYTIQKQVAISGRYVDFLLPEKIIVEMDGIYHFTAQSMQFTDDTEYRNMHLLLIGYRLILINIYQYNLNRETHQLKSLIESKLNILQKHKAVLVV